MIRIELRSEIHDGAGGTLAHVTLTIEQGGDVLRESTVRAVERVQRAIDAIPDAAAPGQGGAPAGDGATASGVTDADLDTLDGVLTDQAVALEKKIAPAAAAGTAGTAQP